MGSRQVAENCDATRLVRLVVGAAWVSAAAWAADPVPQDWPLFRGNPALDGVARCSLPDKPVLLWTHECKVQTQSAPVVGDGRVYIGTDDGRLLALDLRTGAKAWEYKGGEAFGAPPGYSEGRVFIGDRLGTVHAVDGASGAKLWTFAAEQEILASPNFGGSYVLIGSYDYSLYCLDAATGQKVWQVETDAQVHCTACVAARLTAVAGCDGVLRLIDWATGKQAASVELGDNIAASPAFDGERFYLATFAGAMLCVQPGLEEPVVWRKTESDGDAIFASAAVSGGAVVFAGRDKVVRCLDAATGKQRWRFRTRGEVDSSPVIVGDRVVFGSQDGQAYIVELRTGRKRWGFVAGAPINAAPAVASGRLVLAAEDGAVYCFGPRKAEEAGGTR